MLGINPRIVEIEIKMYEKYENYSAKYMTD